MKSKRLLALLCVSIAIGAVVVHWIIMDEQRSAYGQVPQEAATPPDFDTADSLVQQEQYEAAALMYADLAEEFAGTPKGQQAMVKAADSLIKAGWPNEALFHIEAAIADRSKPYWTQAALRSKALALMDLGRYQEALDAVQRLRLEFPEAELAVESLDIKAAIDGISPAGLNVMKTRELEALERINQARTRVTWGEAYDEQTLQFLDALENDYADTAAILAALPIKGFVLGRMRRCYEAADVYRAIIDRVSPVAPEAELVREAAYRLAEITLLGAKMKFSRAVREGKWFKPSPEWEEVREELRLVLKWGRDVHQIAEARVYLVGTDIAEKKYKRARGLAELYLKEYAGDRKLRRFPSQIFHLELLQAEIEWRTQNFQLSLEIAEQIPEQFALLSVDQQNDHDLRTLVARAYYHKRLMLVCLDASLAEREEVRNYVVRNFPDTIYGQVLRDRYGP